MDWTIIGGFIGIAALIIGATGVLATILFYSLNRLEGDINKLSSRLDGHAARIDQLYRIFLESQKENNQKFYDLLKEKKS